MIPLGVDPSYTQEIVPLLGPWEVTRIPFQHGTVTYRERRFVEDHLDMVQDLADAASLGYLRSLDLQERDQARRRLILELEKELQTAHQMQMDLMPDHAPQVPHFDMVGRCIPATHVGG